MSLRLPDSGAGVLPDGRRVAPSATRNAAPIRAVLEAHAPRKGKALEIASGSGQHVAELALALPGLEWCPSDRDAANLASISAWAAWSGAANIRVPLVLDACAPGWAQDQPPLALVLVVNLLHLVSDAGAAALVAETAKALAPGGLLAIYGPFLRDGKATSEGDAAFDASLRAQDATLGYKDLGWVLARLDAAGLGVEVAEMPANNLMLLARRVEI